MTEFLVLPLTSQTYQVQDTQQGVFTTIYFSRKTPLSRMVRGSIDPIAYIVESTNELERLYQKTLQLQLPIDQYIERGYFKSLYVREPNGLRIEIATATPGFTLDESIEALEKTLALPVFIENK